MTRKILEKGHLPITYYPFEKGREKEREVAEQIVKDLMEACKTLMDEVCQKAATNWGIVNDAMVAGDKYIKANQKKEK